MRIMSKIKNPVCLHFHIFKNAGTTIDWTLKKFFLNQHLTMDEQAKSPTEIFSWHQVIDFLNKHPTVKAFSSHLIRFPIPENTQFHFLPIVFIRHPIDRAFSIYSFLKKDSDNSITSLVAKTGSLEEFIKWNLKIKKYAGLRNFQVFFLSHSVNDDSLVNSDDYVLAIERIQKCTVAGIVDRLDESLVVAENFLKPYFEKIDLSYKKQNVSKDRIGSILQRLEFNKQEIGEELFSELISHNNFDLQLYNDVNENLNKQIATISDFDEKLLNYQERCKKLQ